ncbi:hypothetical protein AC93_5097 [Escherichia coli 2-005-03_S4_C2]|nr:hypothetical protein AD23_1692 [Escherichia coli 2-005-03_S4_C3]EZJ63559.1 hypothetical protein AC93_5097 [Escherichia coli 2-005-03_S4_C2]KDT35403.1 hypothetical protein AC67_5141 [Escherichia coli 2-052-05_S4_C1]
MLVAIMGCLSVVVLHAVRTHTLWKSAPKSCNKLSHNAIFTSAED